MNNTLICGVIIGVFGSPKQAKQYAEIIKNCPYVFFLFVDNDTVCLICTVPKSHIWWLKYPELNPGRLGFQKANVYVCETDPPDVMKLHFPYKKGNRVPCDADCETCDLREKFKCPGCRGARVLPVIKTGVRAMLNPASIGFI